MTATLHLSNTASFEMSQLWRAVCNHLTGLRFESYTSHYGDERVIARPTNR